MKTFPMFLRMSDRRVIIVGGGEQAAQKCRLMLKTEAQIEIAATRLDDELKELAQQGRVKHISGALQASVFRNTALVFVATGCPGADASVQSIAKEAGAVINVVDQPGLCDAITPSIVDRDPVVVAIGTEGTAPVLARQIKTRMEQLLEPRLGDLAATAGRLRTMAAHRLGPRARRDLWRWVFNDEPRKLHALGSERDAIKIIKTAILDHKNLETGRGSVSLVGAGPGARDLITLRGVQRLQEADIIFYDKLVDPEVLELARRDAERVFVGKAPGCHAWPQHKISEVLVSAAKRGQRVVRLKCGDPGIFARGQEEIDALTEAGIQFEIVPGVTAASAAVAAEGGTLTERGRVNTLILSTGHGEDGLSDMNWLETLKPGTRVAFYMAVKASRRIDAALLAHSACRDLQIEIIADAQMPSQRVVSCRAGQLQNALARHDIQNNALIIVTLAHDRANLNATTTPDVTPFSAAIA